MNSYTQLLSQPEFCAVEKIKTIGSTYMAAAGLHPGLEGYHDNERKSVATMANFAIAMMEKLERINMDSFNQFKLRIGENWFIVQYEYLASHVQGHILESVWQLYIIAIFYIHRVKPRSPDSGSDRSQEASVWYLGWYRQCRQSHGQLWRVRKNSGLFMIRNIFYCKLYSVSAWPKIVQNSMLYELLRKFSYFWLAMG